MKDQRRITRRMLAVTFVDDAKVQKIKNGVENAEVQATPLGECNRNRNTRTSCPSGGLNSDLPPLEEEEITEDVPFKPTELLEEERCSLTGSSMFGFSTPRKRLNMLEKAESAKKTHMSPRTPKTPKTPRMQQYSGSRTPKTPKSASKFSGIVRTPKSRRSLSDVTEDPKTPYSFRKRVKQRIKKIVCEEDSSSSSSEEESENDSNYSSDDGSSDEDKENSGMMTPGRTPRRILSTFDRTPSRRPSATPSSATPGKTPSRGRHGRKVKDVEMVAKAEDYFSHQGDSRKVVTSDRTLNHLQTPRLSPEALQTLLMDVTLSHPKERTNLMENHIQMFAQWMTFLCESFSIFLYGLGSKKLLVNQFQQQYLGDIDHLVINGFFPSLTLRSILNTITEDILEHIGSFHSYQDHLEFIQKAYSKPDAEPLFILIHNLDGPMLRAEKIQTIIARLASLPKVYLVASIDHINAPLIFDGGKMSYYNALWYDATTLAPYSEETSYENSLLVQQSGALALSSLIHVFKSLTPNAKGIFLLLAQHQLDQKDNSNYTGLSFGDMYQRCRESFLVNSDLTLRAQLTEFKDHKLIRSKKGADGIESLLIPLDSSTLHDFISQQDL